jgi:putative ABC transport system substrate-binding protein
VVASLPRPGGNLTGFTMLVVELTAKKLDLITELVPRTAAIALLVNPKYPNTERIIQDTQQAAEGGAASCPESLQRSRDR